MINLKDYAATIRNTIRELTKEDKYYRWSVKAINVNTVKFTWGYISDVLNEKDECFVLHVHEGLGAQMQQYVIVNIPCTPATEYICKLVGPSRWDDAPTLEGAIDKAIRSAARYAMETF